MRWRARNQRRTASEVIDEWMACQRNWQYLEPIFSSDDIQKQLPLEYTRFSSVDQKWRKNMAAAKKTGRKIFIRFDAPW